MKVRRKQGGTAQAVEKFFDTAGLHTGRHARGVHGWFSVSDVAIETGKHRSTVRAAMNGLVKVGALESVTVYYPHGGPVRVFRKVETKWAPPHAGISRGVVSSVA